MENEALTRINDFLSKHNANINTIPKARLNQFLKVDTAIQTRLAKIIEAHELLNGRPFNLSVIADESGVARKTFYNNKLLGMYVEMYSDAYPSLKEANSADFERLQKRCEEAEARLTQFYQRDIRMQETIHENAKLQDEIRILQNRYNALETQCEQLRAKMADMMNPPRTSNIVPLKPVKKTRKGE